MIPINQQFNGRKKSQTPKNLIIEFDYEIYVHYVQYIGVIAIQEFKNQFYFLKFSPQDGEKGQKVARNGRNYTGL